MKKIVNILSLILLVACLLVSCAQNNDGEEPKFEETKVTVSAVEVIEYDKTVEFGQDYNQDSVKVEVTFSDETKQVYSGADLAFDYREFDIYTTGKQTIRVVVISLNASQNFTVEVKKREIKVIFISNSFGDDTKQWVHEIGEEFGIDFTVANLYIGGCVLKTHLDNLKGDKAAYEYKSYDKSTKTWNSKALTKISTAMTYEDWDYVVLQQGSYESGRADSYDTINQVMDEVLKLKNDVEFVWNMTWAYQEKEINGQVHANFGLYNKDQMNMYNKIVEAVQTKVVTNDRFKYIIPNGTAVQNARTSYIGDDFCRDIYCHLTYDFGRYIAGLTFVAVMAEIDITNINYSPNLEFVQKQIAIESVKNAILCPYVVTESTYK